MYGDWRDITHRNTISTLAKIDRGRNGTCFHTFAWGVYAVKRFRVAVAGCGVMAETWVKYAFSREDVEIVALADAEVEKAEAMAGRHGLTSNVYRDIVKAIEASNANLVFDVTPPKAHKEVVISALRSGCDVLGEKPMAASLEEARDMVSVAEETGRMYAVMQNRRYTKNIRAIRELVLSGTIGRVGFICADFFLGPHFADFRTIMDNPLILDMGIHTFDQARFITGSDPVSVYCHEFNPPGSWYKGDAAAVCIFELRDGSIFCYRGSWCAEGSPTPWDASWRIIGSKGTAIWNGTNVPRGEIVVPSDEAKFLSDVRRIEATTSWNGREGHFGCLDEMFSALSDGRSAETDCRDNLKSMAMVFGAIESAREGRKVQI